MKQNPQKRVILTTPGGDVKIQSFCTPEQIRKFTFDSQFRQYDNFKSLYTKRESLEKDAKQPNANVTLALEKNTNIIGYGVLADPVFGKRWEKMGHNLMMELKAIEVCRAWRSFGLAGGMLNVLMSDPKIEDSIIVIVAYSWTWDLDYTKESASQHRNKLVNLHAPHGFKEYPTNDPNVMLRPENIFMARIGKNISREQQDRFKWAIYGL